MAQLGEDGRLGAKDPVAELLGAGGDSIQGLLRANDWAAVPRPTARPGGTDHPNMTYGTQFGLRPPT
jgi:hypothetical protein